MDELKQKVFVQMGKGENVFCTKFEILYTCVLHDSMKKGPPLNQYFSTRNHKIIPEILSIYTSTKLIFSLLFARLKNKNDKIVISI